MIVLKIPIPTEDPAGKAYKRVKFKGKVQLCLEERIFRRPSERCLDRCSPKAMQSAFQSHAKSLIEERMGGLAGLVEGCNLHLLKAWLGNGRYNERVQKILTILDRDIPIEEIARGFNDWANHRNIPGPFRNQDLHP